MPYKLITAPSVEPVSMAIARLQCHVDGNEEDDLIASFVQSARESAEHETGRALCTQTRELVLDAFPPACVLRGAPIQSVSSVRFLDSTGAEVELDPQDYQVDKDSEPGYVVPAHGKSWPATYPVPNAVRVRYVCGYGGADDVPEAIKSWMRLAIGTMFKNRESIAEGGAALPDRFWARLLDPFRVYEGL